MRYYSLNEYCLQQFGEKIYKLALDGGMTCPNRDGTLDTRGCIFCSRGGSGDFTVPISRATITEQIEIAKSRIAAKSNARRFIAYFQSFTNTYAPLPYLRSLFTEAISHPDIAVLSIATRPDCLPEEVLDLLCELNQIKPVWVELGLQTSNDNTAQMIRRGYPTSVFSKAVSELQNRSIHVIAHVIIGLPGETFMDLINTVDCVSDLHCNGIKLQLLHILEGTDLADEYLAHPFHVMSKEEYISVLLRLIRRLPPDMVIHRITGDGPKALLLAPLWSANKKDVLNSIHKRMEEENIFQGQDYLPQPPSLQR